MEKKNWIEFLSLIEFGLGLVSDCGLIGQLMVQTRTITTRELCEMDPKFCIIMNF